VEATSQAAPVISLMRRFFRGRTDGLGGLRGNVDLVSEVRKVAQKQPTAVEPCKCRAPFRRRQHVGWPWWPKGLWHLPI
jgi:hypothetical protein